MIITKGITRLVYEYVCLRNACDVFRPKRSAGNGKTVYKQIVVKTKAVRIRSYQIIRRQENIIVKCCRHDIGYQGSIGRTIVKKNVVAEIRILIEMSNGDSYQVFIDQDMLCISSGNASADDILRNAIMVADVSE